MTKSQFNLDVSCLIFFCIKLFLFGFTVALYLSNKNQVKFKSLFNHCFTLKDKHFSSLLDILVHLFHLNDHLIKAKITLLSSIKVLFLLCSFSLLLFFFLSPFFYFVDLYPNEKSLIKNPEIGIKNIKNMN